MAHFPSAEADGNLDLVAVLQKALCVTQLGVEVVGIDVERQTDFLDFDDALVLAGFLFPFGLLETELAVIDNLANRGLGLRGEFSPGPGCGHRPFPAPGEPA